MKPIIVFIHINKCGGTTLQHLFHNNFTTYFTLYPRKKNRKALTNKEFNKIFNLYPFRGIGGHTLDAHSNYTNKRKIIYVVFFREPISRYMSQLNFRITRNVTKDIDHFLDNDHFDNYQIKRFSKSLDIDEACKFLSSENVFIGLLSDFDRSLNLLSAFFSKYNIPFDTNYKIANVTKSSSNSYKFKELNDGQQKLIVKKNQKDIDLYDKVLELYDQKSLNLSEYMNTKHIKGKPIHFFNSILRKPKQAIVKAVLQSIIEDKQ